MQKKINIFFISRIRGKAFVIRLEQAKGFKVLVRFYLLVQGYPGFLFVIYNSSYIYVTCSLVYMQHFIISEVYVGMHMYVYTF